MLGYILITFIVIIYGLIYANKLILRLSKYFKSLRDNKRKISQIKSKLSKVNFLELESEVKRIKEEVHLSSESLKYIKKFVPLTKYTKDFVYLNSKSLADKLIESNEVK